MSLRRGCGTSRYDGRVRRRSVSAAISLAAVGGATAGMRLAHVASPTIVALGYLLVVLFVAANADLWTAAAASVAAMLAYNFFFLPPVGTFAIADPQNWAALVAFLAVSIVASNLSASARARAREALERRSELTRLFDLTRDVLLTTDRDDALSVIARHVARRFELEIVAICVPGNAAAEWDVHQGGAVLAAVSAADLDHAYGAAAGAIEFDARTRAYGGQREVASSSGAISLAPVRIGARAIGLLATGGRTLEAGTRDAVAGIVAIALERTEFLQERHGAELTRQRAELSSALLASLSHDLRTPLTTIRTALANLASEGLPEEQRREQARLASDQTDRLTRLFEEILDMGRIDSGSVEPQRAWTTPAEIVEAAMSHAAAGLTDRDVRTDARDNIVAEVDPRLISAALAHVLENAARYAPEGMIDIRGWIEGPELRLEVRDRGPGLQPRDLERLFEAFYRGEGVRQAIPGTGMGLAIARGLINAHGGRVWAENIRPRGASFTIAVPAPSRPVAPPE